MRRSISTGPGDRETLRQAGLSAEASLAARHALGNVTLAREDTSDRGSHRGLTVSAGCWRTRCERYARPAFAASMVLVTALRHLRDDGCVRIARAASRRGPARARAFTTRVVWLTVVLIPGIPATGARSDGLFSGFFAWNLERRHVQWQGSARNRSTC